MRREWAAPKLGSHGLIDARFAVRPSSSSSTMLRHRLKPLLQLSTQRASVLLIPPFRCPHISTASTRTPRALPSPFPTPGPSPKPYTASSSHLLALATVFKRSPRGDALESVRTRQFSTSPTHSLAMRPSYYQGSSGNSYGRGRRGQDPFSTLKARLDGLPGLWVLGSIIGLNVLVFGAWQYGGALLNRFRDPSWLIFLRKNFTTSWANVSSGRVFGVLPCC